MHLETKGHNVKQVRPQSRASKWNKLFKARITDNWNSLTKVVGTPSINVVKSRQDKFETEQLRSGTLYEH